MREIKFRAVDLETNEIYGGDRIEADNSIIVTLSYGQLVAFYIGGDYQELKLIQWTGLYDSKGEEIYEVDIVRFKQRNLEAAFGMAEGEDYIEKTRKIIFNDQSFNVPQGFIKELEVIGNVYENPEFSKVKSY